MYPIGSAALVRALRSISRNVGPTVRRAPVPSSCRAASKRGAVRFSTEGAAPKPAAASSPKPGAVAAGGGSGEVAKTDTPMTDVFFDNAGKIFIGFIVSIIAMVVRSTKGGTNKNSVRDEIENSSALDPFEIDDLRSANPTFDCASFLRIARVAAATFPHGDDVTYSDFVGVVLATLGEGGGAAVTLRNGHLLDRAVFAAGIVGPGAKRAPTVDLFGAEDATAEKYPLLLLLAALSMALGSATASPDERIAMLFECCQTIGGSISLDDGGSGRGEENGVSLASTIDMVGHLQSTCQLPSETQVVATDTKYPIQTHRVASPEDLVRAARKLFAENRGKEEAGEAAEEEDTGRTVLDFGEFAKILKSKHVCVWGECYFPKRKRGNGSG
mmetsp:Transcript_3368/g.6984  ORF Transcript_3368/g.6984 Transcript_3368/m.6984 type:complete len:386 (+) Transcript_3368:65-1222(+)